LPIFWASHEHKAYAGITGRASRIRRDGKYKRESSSVARHGGTVFGYRTTAIRLAYFGQRSPSDVEKILPVLKTQPTKH
jgi:hypothetical protein